MPLVRTGPAVPVSLSMLVLVLATIMSGCATESGIAAPVSPAATVPATAVSPWLATTTQVAPSAAAVSATVPSTPAAGGNSTGQAAPNQIPVIRSLTASPTQVDTPPCGVSTRPTVTARVTDADDAPESLNVRLSYYFSALYQGEVRMRYSAAAKAFTYQLPAFEQKHNPTGDGGHISLGIVVTDPSAAGPPPYHGAIITVNGCIVVSNG